MERSETIEVNIKTKDIYSFFLQHSYKSASGIFGLVLSIVALIMLFVNFDVLDDTGKVLLTVCAMLFTIFEPAVLYGRAKSQVASTKAYKKPLQYEFNNEGITVSQDEAKESISWDKIVKVRFTKTVLIAYTTKNNAFVFPLRDVGDKLNNILQLITENTKIKVPNKKNI